MEGTTGQRKVRSIQGVRAHEILDSRGNPTVQVYVTTEDGTFEASVPSGASTGAHEAHELRDGDKSRYKGKGVLQAVKNVIEIIGPHLKGKDPTQQREIDQAMNDLDGTENKSRLGANAILGVSLAVARAGAAAKGIPLYRHFADLFGNSTLTLPLPSFNVINGGQHAGNHLAFQEYMIRPVGCATYSEALQVGAEVYHTLRTIITEKYGLDAKNVGDEGGFAPNIKDNREGLELIMAALEKCGHKDKVVLAMDCAASEFYVAQEKSYDLNYKFAATEGSQKLTSAALGAFYLKLLEDYPIDSIEDPFAEDDWEAWSTFSPQVMDRVQIVGDDLTVTSEKRVQRAIDCNAANSVLLKLNQIGTVSECMRAAQVAKENGWSLFVSHRSGETEDHYLADFAVGINAGQLKTGAPCRSERLSKYNRLLVIEHELGSEAVYAPTLTKKST